MNLTLNLNIAAPMPRSNNLGAVYTPDMLALWAAQLLAQFAPATSPLKVIDPACGEGALLQALMQLTKNKTLATGVDVSSDALRAVHINLPAATIFRQNALALLTPSLRASLLNCAGYNAVIMNPPWGADPGFTPAQLREMGYTLAKGQFDTYDLFLELSLRLLNTNGLLVAIIPDSLFLPEHEPLRRLLTQNTEICLIARLGEGFFEGVFRGTAVIVARKCTPRPDHKILCMRLTKEWRQKILTGRAALYDAQVSLGHYVKQKRFAEDAAVRFDIDLRENEERVVSKIAENGASWTDWFISGRGVELSKTGRVLRCPRCASVCPVPRVETEAVTCRECGKPFSFQQSAIESLVRPYGDFPDEQWRPLIVGEDVDRYHCCIRREIKFGVRGINYKTPETFASRKLLLRKTGLGIKAAIDATGAYTNQVVFHYIQKEVAPEFAMDYALGVLNSRILLAFHLKSLGETEWRSHPYITQKVIASLPVPKLRPNTWQWRQGVAIAEAVRNIRLPKRADSAEDFRIERLCAGLFNLTARDCDWVKSVLDKTEGLEPLRTLRFSDTSCILPIRVE